MNHVTFDRVVQAFCLLMAVIYVVGYFWSNLLFDFAPRIFDLICNVPIIGSFFKNNYLSELNSSSARFLVTASFYFVSFCLASVLMFFVAMKENGDHPLSLTNKSAVILLVFNLISISYIFYPDLLGNRTKLGKLVIGTDFLFFALACSFFFGLCFIYLLGRRLKTHQISG
jgi:hypothetical protein